MRVPHSWLTEVLQRSTPQWQVTPEELDEGFVRVGFEVEELDSLDTVTGPLVVGRVTSIEELTEFKKPIRFCHVDVGNDEPQEIVCGARNFAEGDLIVAALPGSVLPGGFAIAARKTYGKTSNGMICSTAELGLGRDSSGILVLPEGTAAPGDDAKVVLGMDDSVIELNVTPDRGYAFSVRGLARELASSFDLDYADPAAGPVQNNEGDTWPTTVEPESGASRFALRKVSGIDPKAVTPWWMQRRLLLAGIRPISAAVDVTNYVLHELGQPLHAFDAAKLTGGIVVRRAKAGEKLTTLDDVERTLDAEDVVIADDSGAISLAGVMGGASTEVGDDTVDVILEAATFDPLAVFRTGRRHKLSSEASKRFERTVDSALPVAALDRAAQLLVEIAGGHVEPVLTDIGSVHTFPAVRIDIDLPDRVAGVTYPNGVAARRLTQIGCDVEVGVSASGHGELVVTPPSWRPDLQQPADLVEEVLRLEGLEQIPSVLPAAPAGRGLTATQKRKRAVGKSLAFAGYVEVLPTVFLPTGVFDIWGLPADDARRRTTSVLNPLEADRPELATTILPGLLEILARNVSRGQRDLSLFGIAQVVLPGDDTAAVEALAVHTRPSDEEIDRLRASLPAQPVHVGVVLSGQREPSGPWGQGRAAEASDAFDAARTVAAAAGVDIELRAAQYLPWHPGRCAEILVDGVVVGHAGELHPAVLERADLPARTCAVELNLDALPIVESLPAPVVSPFPAVLQDVAVVVDRSVPAADVESALRTGAGELLESLRLFDVFEGEQVGENRKSLAFALVFRSSEGTLTEAQATEARDAAVAAAAAAVGAELRR
ncbi:phenylalanine--tRNA ligase subunit beta [Rhodococcus sp. BP-252]|uniref:phenylalanine--tRNA ligase subunit beta n=1 Tax=unclassified Rhodococcus (in: high G+C Gram-positive bacteria) TaxID=192944 RepID=UPI001430A591|nr:MULTISPECIES: phenylalanine--tRNA ligase subunit beta [unclassified Rhodococcus (in: high G+C Gram-positive bacteria)]NIL74611.1 Phenylalanine--tRNA ligase beta subunit [Rhodococcus sp. B10]MBY6411240.1 phenylalanine--tRNA ligase subunit beta [Rhodococcus sp. BP-320]MBY6415899.1 phenylalanine--tRNA ligase subunit beta [Rhodococcus sp. BP-321]MBY6420592.1 phenylalanine--tRNA ligase subunit beta [Rhodococcus sp. BP-324]MBY6426106.1 phenylalanine--tRNA ligase subunit beta [Rhodococcus sp. BP-3